MGSHCAWVDVFFHVEASYVMLALVLPFLDGDVVSGSYLLQLRSVVSEVLVFSPLVIESKPEIPDSIFNIALHLAFKSLVTLINIYAHISGYVAHDINQVVLRYSQL